MAKYKNWASQGFIMKNLLGKTLGNYKLTRVLGQGRMGIVYLAHDKALLRPTALKLLAWTIDKNTKQDPVKWFLSEARSVARISHPNVIQIYNIAKHKEYHYIAMEFVDGESVQQALENKGRFLPIRAADIILQTCNALDAAHQAGVIHSDIKPANLLLRKDGTVKLSDFGMAQSSYEHSTFSVAMRVGTPFFNAPETWTGSPASAASDIYAVGVTFFLLLTGKLPFNATNMEQLMQAHLTHPPNDPYKYVPNLPEGYFDIIQKCLEKRPYKRYKNVAELRDAISIMLDKISKPSIIPAKIESSNEDVKSLLHQMKYKTAKGLWETPLKFSVEPFCQVDPLNSPYNGEPFRNARETLKVAVSGFKKIILVYGQHGSGKTTLLYRHALEVGSKYQLLYLSPRNTVAPFSLISQLCKMANLNRSDDNVLAKLTTWFVYGAGQREKHVLLYLDDIIESEIDVEETILLLRSITLIDKCTVIISSSKSEKLQKIHQMFTLEKSIMIKIPQLNCHQVTQYIQSWLQKARSPLAPFLIFTTDATLWVAHKSKGNLNKINQLARSMFTLASYNNLKIITSWEAWYCAQQLELGNDISKKQIFPPANWPTQEVINTINEYRKYAGFSPQNIGLKNKVSSKKITILNNKGVMR
jgi:serine/threonine protein kinase